MLHCSYFSRVELWIYRHLLVHLISWMKIKQLASLDGLGKKNAIHIAIIKHPKAQRTFSWRLS